jgi:hypothetical protein
MASNPSFRLVNTRYVPPGVYIGQLIIPRPTNLTADARLPAFVGVGNRLAVGKNIAMRRSFIFEESLAFTSLSPHVATLQYAADQDQNAPGIKLYKQDGTIVRADFWSFTESSPGSGVFNQVTISLEAFDPTATYILDYQSVERTPQDIIPVEELREVVNVGLAEDAPQFRENLDFFIVTDVTSPVLVDGNVNTDSVVTAITADGGNTGAGVITQASSSQFDHNYNRYYQLSCISASGSSPNRLASFTYTSTPTGGGNDALPPRPLHAVESAPTINIVEGTNQFGIEIELGIELDFAFPGGAGNFAVADDFSFHGFGPGLVEEDARYENENQFAETTGIVVGDDNTGSGSISVASTTDFNRDFNTGYSLRVVGVAGVSPTRTVTFAWSTFIELGPNGTFTADEAVPNTLTESLAFGVDVDIDFGSSNFAVGDDFAFIAKAPALRYSGKDNRTYTLTHGSTSNIVSLPVAQTDPLTGSVLAVPHVVGTVVGEFNTDTPEGGFGVYEASQQNWFDPLNPDARTGHFLFPNNVKLAFRNQCRGDGFSGNREQPGDEFEFTANDQNRIDWSLVQKREQEFETDDFITDVNGTVTGIPGTTYIILVEIPEDGTVSVVTTSGLVSVSSVEIPGSPFVSLPVAPTETITVTYETKGAEPDPGQLYYFTGNFLRGAELYNNPILVLDRDDGRTLLGPAAINNHLHIVNELAFDNNVFGAYYIQVADADEDGVYQQTDFKTALLSTENVNNITDRVVLSRQDAWGDQLAVNERANDPFARRESLDWFGAPIGTPIGDRQTPDTLRYISDKTLRVYGSSPSHGTRILAGPTQATVNIVLQSGDTVSVTVDGSFVAAALASLTASFSDPANTILKKNLSGFTSVQTYTPKESALLGDAGSIYVTDLGNGVVRIEEDTTVDTFAIDFYLISAMTQKQFVTKVVRREMANSVVALIVPSAQAGVGIIKASLSAILLGLLGRGIIGQYEDASQNVRKFDPDSDVVVFRDSADPTLYHMFYAYFLRFPIKRVFGLFTVNTNDFGSGN